MTNFACSNFKQMTIPELIRLKESEDKVEFKEAKTQYSYNSGKKSVLGYVVALANERGGYLVFGVRESSPHEICGSAAFEGREGKLEQDIYRDLKIRVQTETLNENGKRVLVVKVPSRPVGKPLYFEDVPLMRVGESLTRMSEEMYASIIQETEPDFSAKICDGLTSDGLDEDALFKLKNLYADRQGNEAFRQISNEQMLSDLRLSVNGNPTFAALILLGKQEQIEHYLPQCRIIWEYRNTETQIHYDKRETIVMPFILGIDRAWELVDQPTLNLNHPLQAGPVVYNVYDFNRYVIRESILNSYAHRDYTLTSDVVIKQYPEKIEIINPGGFPKGVTVDNILTVSSTPRNILIADILEKTGLVERSGQGVDRIFSVTLSEGKKQPDYSDTNPYQVTLKIQTKISDENFCIFIHQYQNRTNRILGAEQIITLSKVRDGNFSNLNPFVTEQLKRIGLIKNIERSALKYTLSDDYFRLSNEESKIGDRYIIREVESLLLAFRGEKKKISELAGNLSNYLNTNQIKYLLDKLIEDNVVKTEGKNKGRTYRLEKKYEYLQDEKLLFTILDLLKKKYS
jgi:ATP-dependent DNA helicase RecG